jgi:hypothetical protein
MIPARRNLKSPQLPEWATHVFRGEKSWQKNDILITFSVVKYNHVGHAVPWQLAHGSRQPKAVLRFLFQHFLSPSIATVGA